MREAVRNSEEKGTNKWNMANYNNLGTWWQTARNGASKWARLDEYRRRGMVRANEHGSMNTFRFQYQRQSTVASFHGDWIQ